MNNVLSSPVGFNPDLFLLLFQYGCMANITLIF